MSLLQVEIFKPFRLKLQFKYFCARIIFFLPKKIKDTDRKL